MTVCFVSSRLVRVYGAIWLGLIIGLAGCTVGPSFQQSQPVAPDDWSSWRSAAKSLTAVEDTDMILRPEWWLVFNDPILSALQQQALNNSLDLQTAALRFVQARVQRSTIAAQQWPELNFSGSATRLRQSESGMNTYMVNAIGADKSTVIDALSTPLDFYQVGFDASWEIDLWGRVRRLLEMEDAHLEAQSALFDLASLSVVSEVARQYFILRTIQQKIAVTNEDIYALTVRVELLAAQVQGGVHTDLDLELQRAEFTAVKSRLPGLLLQESLSKNQIAVLLGVLPGSLNSQLAPQPELKWAVLPDLALGLPSEVALRRPDIRAAEARLHQVTASIGVATANLYPSVRLGARFGYESYLSGELSDWGSRTWAIGPVLHLPLFDRGRRKAVVQLRELEQQEAAVAYQRTVLKAWQEIDDALSAYTAEQQQVVELQSRLVSVSIAYELAQARYDGGVADFLVVLDSQRSYLQARRDLISSQGRLYSHYIMVNKALGNAPYLQQSRQGSETLN